ncbi:hypothetical protein VKT23_019670 [Stygiomarasmius scandens]|uniref:Uncharacterized protein n=1 Tax=Marasmiellus scandens TaxID=2682957 RepID=A0ABR1IKW4_9AGAR
MPIAVPPNRAGIPAPTAPANPPTDQDIFNAKDYARRVYHAYDSRAQNSPTIAELSLVEQYTLSVVSARAGEAAAPPWFGPALREALAPIQADIRGIKDNVEALQQNVEALQQNVEALQQDVANINAQQRQLGDGVAIGSFFVSDSLNPVDTSPGL